MRRPPRRRTLPRRSGSLVAACATLAFLTAAAIAPAAADEPPFRELYLFRFEFDNDTFLGSDDAFTAGWSFQLHSPLEDAWAPGFAKWIGRVPGLGDDGRGGRIVRWALGLNQIILTPADISIAEPQPNDIP